MSMTKYFCLIALILWTAPQWTGAADASAGPEAFIPNSVHEFKPVVEGTRITHEFTIENRGAEPLEIIDLKSG